MLTFIWGFVLGGVLGIVLTGLATAEGKDKDDEEK